MKPKIAVYMLSSCLMASCHIHWNNATDWTLYGYQGSRMFKIPPDSLNAFDTLKLNEDTVTYYLSTARPLNSKDQGLWMGGYVTTCELNGRLRKVDFSNYGNFFYDERSSSYYRLDTSKSEAWIGYLQRSLISLANKKSASH